MCAYSPTKQCGAPLADWFQLDIYLFGTFVADYYILFQLNSVYTKQFCQVQFMFHSKFSIGGLGGSTGVYLQFS